MATSQNGWRVVSKASLHYYPVPGDHSKNPGTVGILRGPVATVLVDLMAHLQQIEAARWPGVWGYAYRPIRGQSSGFSNHASATAIDWNAPRHPRQSSSRHAGWSSAQVDQINRLLVSRYHGLVRWGANYNYPGPYDPMHFEINGDENQIQNLAEQIAAANKPKPTPAPKKVLKMQWLAQTSGKSAVYLTDGIQRRWIQTNGELLSIQGFLRKGGLDDSVIEYAAGNIDKGMAGVLVGPEAPEGTH